MPNIASLLKAEITRLARRELRLEIEPLKKNLAGYRSDIAALKKQVRAQEIELKRLARGASSRVRVPEPNEEPSQVRFRPDGMKSHRQKLGLSAKDYGLLIGASGLSVYKWESGKVEPRAKAMPRIVETRKLGKREALARLEQLQSGA